MNLNSLKPKIGSTHKNSKRLGRGEGSGKGGTSSRGHKGAKSRSGYSRKIGFEGGQMPLQRRVPKFGFNNFNRKHYSSVNLDTIQKMIDEKKVTKSLTIQNLIDFRVVNKNNLIKILGRGEINSPIKIEANKFSKSAEDSIKNAGGEIVIK